MKHFILILAAIFFSGCVSVRENTARPVTADTAPVAQAAKQQPQKECAISTEYVARYGMDKARRKLAECKKENTAAQGKGKANQKPAAAQQAAKAQKTATNKPKKECAVSLDYIARVGFERAKKELEACDDN